MRKYRQGYYKPKNPDKYKGDPDNIVYRSSWERVAMVFLDTCPNIVKWASEEFPIPYYDLNGKPHKYFIDFIALVQYERENKIWLIEVKPLKQTLPPEPPKRKTEKSMANYQYQQAEFIKNSLKWEAARALCKTKGYEFLIWTEEDLVSFRK